MTKFVELSLDGIEEGTFLKESNEALLKAQDALLAHIRKYGADETAGAASEVTMKVKLKQAKDMEGVFAIETSVTTKVPGRPNTITAAVVAPAQGGGEALHMRPSGTNRDSPRQGRLATQDGRTIDPETGQVKED